jgi:regulator of protease activity HflC (stomatin/prohibitin superfamily)
MQSSSTASAPAEDQVFPRLPKPLAAPIFTVSNWDAQQEPLGMTRLRSGESFLQGVARVEEQMNANVATQAASSAAGFVSRVVSKGCNSFLPGMRVADDQVGIILHNGNVRLRPGGAYRGTMLNPWKLHGAVIPILRQAGVEFDPLQEAAKLNRRLDALKLGQAYRQIVLQSHQIGVFEDHASSARLASTGTYVYAPETSLRGVINLNRLRPVVVQRETEDTVAANSSASTPTTRVNQHGRTVPTYQGHGTTVETTKRFIPAGYTTQIAGITIARPEKGFVVLHKDASNNISMTEGICVASGSQDFLRRAKNDQSTGIPRTMDDLEIEFGDLNHYAKSTPMLELKSKDNLDALCRAQIKWKQNRPDIWVAYRGAFTDPFDMLEEKCANMMRDWLLSVEYLDALKEKAKGFTKVEHQWSKELNDTAFEYGVQVIGLEITTLRFPNMDAQDEQVALQLAETNLAIESSRQNASKEKEMSILNQATHDREQDDRDRQAEAEERQQQVQRRKDVAQAETVQKKAEMDTKVVQAAKMLALAQESQDNEVALAQATSQADAERVRAQGRRDAAQLAAQGAIANTKETNEAQLKFLEQQAALLKDNPGLVDLLKLQNDLLKTQALAKAATTNPNVVLLHGQEGLEARRMNNGHAPQVPGAATTLFSN